jgi:hypothetical protein
LASRLGKKLAIMHGAEIGQAGAQRPTATEPFGGSQAQPFTCFVGRLGFPEGQGSGFCQPLSVRVRRHGSSRSTPTRFQQAACSLFRGRLDSGVANDYKGLQ